MTLSMSKRAIVLAAGLGTRLRPLTASMPKPLLSIGGTPILQRLIQSLFINDVTEVIVVTGYLGEQIRRFLETEHLTGNRVHIVETHDYREWNNIASLWAARSFLDRECIIVDGDVVLSDKVMTSLVSTRGDVVVPYDSSIDPPTGAFVRVTGAHIQDLKIFASKESDREKGNWHKTLSIYKLGENFLRRQFLPLLQDAIETDLRKEFYEQVLARSLHADLKAIGVDCSGMEWIEVDTVDDLAMAENMFGARQENCYATS